MTLKPAPRHLLPAAGLVAAVSFAACTVGPDYAPPEGPIPDVWEQAAEDEIQAPEDPLATWWTSFHDPVLESLIARAREANPSLEIAAARIDEAVALVGVSRGTYWPQLALDASYSRRQQTENGPLPIGGQAFDLWNVGIGASWEIDVFGRVRRTVEAAGAQYQGSIEDYRDVLVILYADVATNYLVVRTFQERIAFAKANAEAQRTTVDLTQNRFDAGLTSRRDVTQAQSNLATTEAVIPSLEATLNAAKNRLAVLLGQLPGSLHDELEPETGVPAPDLTPTKVIPAELLRRRPDVRAAERRLASQTALIGAAQAQLYPSFSLTGFIGLESVDASDLGDSGSLTWSLVPGLRLNLFSGGRIRSQIRAEEARTQVALSAYEQTVLFALSEVEDALVALEKEILRRSKLDEAVGATEETVELVETQYKSGLTDFQSLLDTQRSLFDLQDQLAESEGRVVANFVTLNRALGGGWTDTSGIEDRPIFETTVVEAEPGPGTGGPE